MWSRRIVSTMPWRRSPLRRGSDKIEVWLTLAVIMVALMVAPWVAWWTAHTTYGAELRENGREIEHRAVTAVLLRDATTGRSSAADAELQGPEHVPVPARWTAPDGAVRSGAVPAGVGTPAGSAVTVWVDERGTLTAPPRRSNPALNASVAATFAASAVLALLSGFRRVVVWRLDRRRLRSWEAEWQIVGPRWSRR